MGSTHILRAASEGLGVGQTAVSGTSDLDRCSGADFDGVACTSWDRLEYVL